MTLIGLISDTHGLLRPEVAAALAGVCRILHAGDVGKPEVLDALAAIAPLTTVRGNNDTGKWAQHLPYTVTTVIAGHTVHMRHILAELYTQPPQQDFGVIVSGHTHEPHAERRGGVLLVNPGSAGPRRFSLPISIGFLRLSENAAPETWFQTFEV
jgi:putative phosphoesterase